MKKALINTVGTVDVYFDETQIDDTLQEYRRFIDRDATLETLLCDVALFLFKEPTAAMMEGVGYIGTMDDYGDVTYKHKPHAPIWVYDPIMEDHLEFEVEKITDKIRLKSKGDE